MENTLRAHELFRAMSQEQAELIFVWLREGERDVYRNTIAQMAQVRKLRPVFVQKKPVPQQMDWLKQSLSRLQGEDVATHLLQVWLLRERSEMLVCFLDEVGIEHDGEGGVEDLPDTLEQEKLKQAIDALCEKFGEEEVRLYLHLFQRQKAGGWDNLDAALGADERLSW